MSVLLKTRWCRAIVPCAILILTACVSVQPFTPGSVPSAKIAGRAPSGDLIYAGAADGSHIYIFSYPQGALVRTFKPPSGTIALQGLCSDRSGNVFITSLSKAPKSGVMQGYVYKYAHGGTKILNTLTFYRVRPFGCAVDPKSGTLAVTTVGVPYQGGTIETFTRGSYYSKTYYGVGISNFYFCTYDDAGNLFANGEGNGTQMYLNELPQGQTQPVQLSLDKYVSVSGAGQLQWDGRRVAFEQLTEGAIYRLDISGSKASLTRKATLDGWNGAGLSAIVKSRVIVPTGASETGFGFWKYPAGGKALKTASSPSALFGLTVSSGSGR